MLYWAMPAKTHDKRPLTLLLSALALGVFGQFFLAQREIPWTLWPGLLLLALAGLLFAWSIALIPRTTKSGMSLSTEIGALGFIFLVALGTRLYRLDQFPAGIYYDE